VIRKLTDKAEWHSWFAWYPVVTICKHVVWLDRVERKWTEKAGAISGYDGYCWIADAWTYRLPSNE